MNNPRLLTILTLAALLAACQRETLPQGSGSASGARTVTLQAVFSDAPTHGTKVAISQDGSANTFWSVGDQIAVHVDDGSYHVFDLWDGDGTATATFEGEFSGSQDYYAVYPASAKVDANYGNSTLEVTLPASYTISGSMGNWSPVPMIATNSGSTLSFKHVGSVCRLTLDDVPAGTNKITVTFDKDVTGTFTVTDPGTAAPYIATTTGTTRRTVTFNLSSALAAETDGFVLNVPVPTGTYAGNMRVSASGGDNALVWIPNTRTISRATGIKTSTEALWRPPLTGSFTINSSGDKVSFSPGNLQYIGSAVSPYWKFAAHQFDSFRNTAGKNGNGASQDRDLFGWGTSGWNGSGVTSWINYQPWAMDNTDRSATYPDNTFGYGPDHPNNLTDYYRLGDWGQYNAIYISNRSLRYPAGTWWRTLTYNEWVYILKTRTPDSGIRFAKARVADVDGVILLPDDWSTTYYTLVNTNSGNSAYEDNVISESQWNTSFEPNGAVFLPVTGHRGPTQVWDVTHGYYWSSTSSTASSAVWILFGPSSLTQSGDSKHHGAAVRLVCDL